MKGLPWVQIIKAVLLITGAALMTVMVLGKFVWELPGHPRIGPVRDLHATTKGRVQPRRPGAGCAVRRFAHLKINFVSLASAVLGTAGLPHVLMRFYTVPTAKEVGGRWFGQSR